MTVYVRGTEISASKEEFDYAKLDGTNFEYNLSAAQILDDGLMMRDTVTDEEGNVTDVEGSEHFVPASSVIISISQVPQHRLVNRDKDLKLNERGNLETNESGETTMPGVFASGDVVTGAKTVVEAVRYSKQIADDMDRYMQEHFG